MSGLSMVGYSAGGFLILSWLAISFMAPSPRRSVVEWFSATSMYLVLVCIFANLLVGALESGNNLSLGAFGFLCILFGAGLVVSIFHAVMEMGGKSEAQQSATN